MFLAHIPSRVPGQAEMFDPAAGRDLQGYVIGGQVGECSLPEGSERQSCLVNRDRARRFIYDHWVSRRRAYIAIDFPCADCMPTLHIFIEPDAVGRWRVVNVLEESRFDPQRRPDAFDIAFRRPTADERRREKAVRVLSFRDSSGTEVDSF